MNDYIDKRFIVTLTIPEDAIVTGLEIKRALYRLIEAVNTEDAIHIIEDVD